MKGISGSKLRLAAIQEQHLDAILKWKNDPELLQKINAPVIFSNATDVHSWYSKNSSDRGQVLLGIFEEEEIIGVARLMFIDWIGRTAELGIFIGESDRRGKGLGTEAVSLLVGYGFQMLNLRKIWLKVSGNNVSARRVYELLGFKEEGVLRSHIWNDGAYQDVILMGLFAPGGTIP